MNVSGLQDRGAVDELVLKITSMQEPRAVKGGTLTVCSCTGEDESGSVTVTLWNEDIAKVKEGDTVKIIKGWSQMYNGDMQVSSGKFGSIELVKE